MFLASSNLMFYTGTENSSVGGVGVLLNKKYRGAVGRAK